MNPFKVSDGVIAAIKDKKELRFQVIALNDIVERVISPIGLKDNYLIYSHYKNTYIGAAKTGIQPDTICETKELLGTSLKGNAIFMTVEFLERAGYTFCV